MFSFFKRGKSKDDGEKKDKPKEKSSFSPFAKRNDSKKEPPPATHSVQPSSSSDSSLNLGISDIQSSKEILKPPPETPVPNVDTESQHTNNTPHSNSNEGFQANVETPSDRFLTPKDEQQYLAPIELPTLAESPSPRPSPVASEDDGFRTEDSVTSDVFERAGSNVSSGSGDRTDSDIVFKTAPNTPVLSKHLTVVSSEVVIDSPDFSDLVVNLSEDSRGPLGANLDFPSADGEESCDTESEPVTEVPEPEEDKNCSMERKICEGMSHNPGELYDIAEEISEEEEEEVQSEDQEEEEEEDDEDEDDDDDEEDSGNVTQPTIEEEYPEEIVNVSTATSRVISQGRESALRVVVCMCCVADCFTFLVERFYRDVMSNISMA
ncbi:hypothetical protein J6590_065904 [Homalodisca vitripennis]|nr:hypothetical protein J6590_065904 [Homalodisca vitripennis]